MKVLWHIITVLFFLRTLRDIYPAPFEDLRKNILPIYIKTKNNKNSIDKLKSILIDWTKKFKLNTLVLQNKKLNS